MTILFIKAHGACNDFLLTWAYEVPEIADRPTLARAICDRNTGVGADGWLVLSDTPDADLGIELWNSDGSPSELSGNGTRCAAAVAVDRGFASDQVRISTGAGVKTLRLLHRDGLRFVFEMNMGRPSLEELRARLALSSGEQDATILNVGNPQCAIFVDDFDFDWRAMGAEIERHSRFPHRTNVSFIRSVDAHTIDVRFFERGAGETASSGTGSTGAAAAAVARQLASSPVRVLTPAGPLELRWQQDEVLLAGPAEIVARGEYFADAEN